MGTLSLSQTRPVLRSKIKAVLRYLRDIVRDSLLTYGPIYRLYLRIFYGAGKPQGVPHLHQYNAVLQNAAQWQEAVRQVKALGLPLRSDPPKNWDSVIALESILSATRPDAAILDAGAELYSSILPWLYLYGYKKLTGINIVFQRAVRRGPIEYRYGDITHTPFVAEAFDVITCLSVIEHGVNLDEFFAECARILRPGGTLIVSTDYYATPIDTEGKVAYGAPIHIFSKQEILDALRLAAVHGLELVGDIDLDCKDKPVCWTEFGLNYTFLTLSLRKTLDTANHRKEHSVDEASSSSYASI